MAMIGPKKAKQETQEELFKQAETLNKNQPTQVSDSKQNGIQI